MSTYYSLPTAAGEAELASALAAQQTVPFTHIAIGDGNGAPVIPDGLTKLVHEVDRVPIASIRQHPVHANCITLEAAIPEDRGGYTIRELAVIGGRVAGTVLAIGNYPNLDKSLPSSGAPSATILRMVVAFTHGTAAINLSIDPQAYATLQTVLDQLAAHEAKIDPHPQYMTGAETEAAIVQGLQAHENEADPHSQYLTATEAGQVAGQVAEQAIAQHEAAQDPHPQYMTQAEMDSRVLASRALRYFYANL